MLDTARDIFKNAYLPYRDPQTLRTFLKIIDEFCCTFFKTTAVRDPAA